ncbi:Uncharacterised protein [Vibrio cholerae]|nr:Uncharacterised protein [Vibrio cholerae]CSB46890.1 Uncharacterised protein [Vibrio cholerae]CSB51220.1 Uncharacterised protein [Vibrio cholerae]
MTIGVIPHFTVSNQWNTAFLADLVNVMPFDFAGLVASGFGARVHSELIGFSLRNGIDNLKTIFRIFPT